MFIKPFLEVFRQPHIALLTAIVRCDYRLVDGAILVTCTGDGALSLPTLLAVTCWLGLRGWVDLFFQYFRIVLC